MQQVNLKEVTLGQGSHETREEGVCLMELVAWLAGEQHSHFPACTSPALADYATFANDHLPDGPRQRLINLAPRLVGTSCPHCEENRVNTVILTMLKYTVCPALQARSMSTQAEELEALLNPPPNGRRSRISSQSLKRTIHHPPTHTASTLPRIAQATRDIAEQMPRTELDDQPETMFDQARIATECVWGQSFNREPAIYEAIWAAHQAVLIAIPQPRERADINIRILRKAIEVCTHRASTNSNKG